MLERLSAIQDADVRGGYHAHAVLEPGALEAIRETNLGFLALVSARHRAEPQARAFGLRPATAEALAALDARALRAAASCPYTLFNLGFDDAPFWQGVIAAHAAGNGSLADEATFARTAVFLAWHLAQSSALTAALVLGMTPPVQQAWRMLPLSALDHAATRSLPRLSARWGDHALFWPKLLEAAAPVDRTRAASVRLLGLQLLAADGIRAERPEGAPLPSG